MKWKPSKVFYGWWIVGASLIIALFTGGAVFYGFTALIEPIIKDTGWSYAQVSLAASIRGMESDLLAPLAGIAADRWGPRRLVFGGGIAVAAGLFLMSRATSLGMLYGAFALIALGMSATTTTVVMITIVHWFQNKVGLASGITVSGYGFSGLLIPLIVRLIELYQWRVTVAILALGALALMLPLSLFFRHKPEQYGYLPDGQIAEPLRPGAKLEPLTAETGITTKQALKSSLFWRLALAFAIHSMMTNATITHIMPYLSTVGMTRAKASFIATLLPLMSIGGRLGFGWFGDKLNRKKVTAVAFVMAGLGLLSFNYMTTIGTWLLVPFLVLFGIGFGGGGTMRPALGREYFGRANFGAIFGLMMGVNALGSVTGPALVGWAYDNWGSYQGSWLIFGGLSIVSMFLILALPSRQRHTSTDQKT